MAEAVASTMSMTPVIVAVIWAVAAVGAAGWSAWSARRIERFKASLAQDQAARQQARQTAIFSAPLAQAAYDLQSRLFNLLRKGFGGYVQATDPRASTYASENTVFLIAQFFCWSELSRQRIHFIELASPHATRRLLALQDRLHAEWATDSQSLAFRIFAGEQRAIGEALIVGEGPESRCMGYGAFLAAFAPGQNGLIDTLRADVATLGTNLAGAQDRLVQIQHTLIEILDLMDPDSLRFPPTSRSKA